MPSLYTTAITSRATMSSTTKTVRRNVRTRSGTSRPTTTSSPSASAVSVDIATPHPRAASPLPLTARYRSTGTTIPNRPATTGRTTRPRSRRSPRSISRRASSPTTRKNSVMSPLLTHVRSSSVTLACPRRNPSGVVHTDSYEEPMFAQTRATTMAAARILALPDSVCRNARTGVANCLVHGVPKAAVPPRPALVIGPPATSAGHLLGHREPRHAAEPTLEPDVLSVGFQCLPQSPVRCPWQWFLVVAPAGSEADPDRGPVRGGLPCLTVPHQERAADLERHPRSVDADRGGAHGPHAQVERHQLELQVAEHARLDEHGGHVLVRGASHSGTLTRPGASRQQPPRLGMPRGCSPRGSTVRLLLGAARYGSCWLPPWWAPVKAPGGYRRIGKRRTRPVPAQALPAPQVSPARVRPRTTMLRAPRMWSSRTGLLAGHRATLHIIR